MTLEGARSTAQNAATRFGVNWMVWRMPKWPEGVYGAIAEHRGAPDDASYVERFTPVPTPVVPTASQGSLF